MDELYSTKLKEFEGEVSSYIQEAINELKIVLDVTELTILKFDDYSIVIPIMLTVPIPPMGTVNDIDIRNNEPMLIRIALNQYPFYAPAILSDRKDFPKHLLPHLYVSKEDKPVGLCLVRNNPNEWFANKTVSDIILVAQQWLYKAAIGKLADDGNEFDPIRLENYNGYHIYKYSKLDEIIRQKAHFIKEHLYSVLLSYGYKHRYQNLLGLTFRSLSSIQYIEKATAIKAASDFEKKQNDIALVFSILISNENDAIETAYSTQLPSTFKELETFFKNREVDIKKIIQSYRHEGLQLTAGIPIIYGIKRPVKLVGYPSEYEFVNFVLMANNSTDDNLPADAPVYVQSHIEPFSKELARTVSGEVRDLKTLYVGAGSLGSKMILHEARAGNIDIGVVDDDNFLQHNLVRHALLNNKIGLNKANAIIEEIREFVRSDSLKGFKAYPLRIHNLSDKELNNYERIVDSTASFDTLNWLAISKDLKNQVVARAEIADEGNLGLFYIEGKNRNPRIDDLVNLVFYQAVNNETLKSWRLRDSKKLINNLNVGLGCSSTTSVMADDTISIHSSIFSRVLQGDNDQRSEGLIYLNILQHKGIPDLKNEYQLVNPFDIYSCKQNSGWQVRMFPGLSSKLFKLCKLNGDIETGGVLIGLASFKTRTIHVFDIITEPEKSYGSYTGFIRGNKTLPSQIDKIKELTGNVIGYIGEWHTHPMNLESLSERDIQTVQQLMALNRQTPIPTCAIIVTQNKILPFIFE